MKIAPKICITISFVWVLFIVVYALYFNHQMDISLTSYEISDAVRIASILLGPPVLLIILMTIVQKFSNK